MRPIPVKIWDFVEQMGKALDLVDNHPTAWRRQPEIRREEGRIGEVVLVARFVEEIHARRTGKLAAPPGALADAADAVKKETLPG